jgi:hypothetical protein
VCRPEIALQFFIGLEKNTSFERCYTLWGLATSYIMPFGYELLATLFSFDQQEIEHCGIKA